MGAKIISTVLLTGVLFCLTAHGNFLVFSLVSCTAAVHGIRAAMHSLKKTGTDFSSANGMDPKAFFEVMGMSCVCVTV
jgi:hypothetical protein